MLLVSPPPFFFKYLFSLFLIFFVLAECNLNFENSENTLDIFWWELISGLCFS